MSTKSARDPGAFTPLQELIVEKIFIGFMTVEELAEETGYSKRSISMSMRHIGGEKMNRAVQLSVQARKEGRMGYLRSR